MVDFSIPGVDPAAGVSLAAAVVLYGELEDPGRHWAVQRRREPIYLTSDAATFELERYPGAVVAQPQETSWDAKYGREIVYYKGSFNKLTLTSNELSLYIYKDDNARKRVIAKLIAGTLHATCFTRDSPLDSSPMAIHQARWHILEPDFENSSAASPDGSTLDGIRIFVASATGCGDCPDRTVDPAPASQRPTRGEEMMRVLPEVLNGNHFKTRKEAYKAVLEKLGITGDIPRGYGLDNFIKRCKKLLQEAGL